MSDKTEDDFDAEEQLLILAKRMPQWKGLLRCCASAYKSEKAMRKLWERQYGELADVYVDPPFCSLIAHHSEERNK